MTKDIQTPITLQDVQEARSKLTGAVKKTPLELSRSISERIGSEAFLKFENLQTTGSFKIRGAMNRILSLGEAEKKKGIVAASAGNHAQGVAFSATHAGVKSKIVMPVTAPLIKVMATKGYGAEVVLKGDYYDQSYGYARELEKNQGHTFVHPFEDPYVIAGQGTLGLELFDDIKDFDSILVSVGGGGLISGIATVAKTLNPKCKIYGIQTAAMPGMATWYREKSTEAVVKATSTIADGVAVKNPSSVMYKTYISRLVDDMCTVGEDEIAEAIVFLMERAKVVVEGSGVLGLAAALSGKLNLGKRTCILLCGGNIDLNIVAKVIERGLKRHGRLSKLVVAAEDRPGALSRMTQVIAQKKANILQVYHDRSTEGLYLNETAIELALETSGFEHFQDIKAALVNEGFRLIR